MGEAINTNDFEVLCKENVRDIRGGRECYIYTDDVLNHTIELLNNLRINYTVTKIMEGRNIFGYYRISSGGNNEIIIKHC